ncbi:MAG: tetratricopeptide repeat protein [Tepidisphaeraceae bacterium]
MTQSLKIEPHKTDPTRWLAPLLVIVAVALAYCNSFQGEMVFDDLPSLRDNPEIQHLIPQQYSDITTTLNGRPVLRFSFALDYAMAGLNLPVLHTTNLLIHIASCLLIYGIIRRMLLQQENWGDRFAESAPWLAAAVAGLWGVHPLNTESVTYLIQRAESLASMFYLAAIYCVIRASESPVKSWRWQIGAVVAAILGMGTKEMVATVPVTAYLFDRIFLKGRGRDRWLMYTGMCLGWLLIGWGVVHGKRGPSISLRGWISPKEYALTQLNAIAHYLRLMVWPRGLILDEDGWPIAHGIGDVGVGGAAVVLLLITTIFMLWRWPKVGFAWAWFFLILAPSSSFVPIVTEVVAEHRMYLPMLGWIALFVIGGWSLARDSMPLRLAESAMCLAMLAAFCVLTLQRNAQYRTAEVIWRDTIAKRPTNVRAHFNLGYSLMQEAHQYPPGSSPFKILAAEAVAEYRLCLKYDDHYFPAGVRMADAMAESGDLAGAEAMYDHLLKVNPEFIGDGNVLRGKIRVERGNFQGAREDFQAATAALPNDAEAHYLLGLADEQFKDWSGAAAEFQRAVDLAPQNADARLQLLTVKTLMGNS